MYNSEFKPYYKNSFAIVIGINRYEYANPLSYARNDAECIASLLSSRLGFPERNVTILLDKDATKEAIMQVYLGLINLACSPDDKVLFFFAGHGHTAAGYQGHVGYLVPTNGNTTNKASLIRWDDLTKNADLIPAKHVFFVLDACFSGLAFKRALQPGGQRFLSEMLQRRARQVITAGKADEVVADGGGSDGKNSIFTGYLIEGLQGGVGNDNGVLTANGLMHYVYDKLSGDNNSKQTPHYGHIDGDGDFVLFAKDHLLNSSSESDVIVPIKPEEPEIHQTNESIIHQPSLYFSDSNGYSNPSHPMFGRNQYSDNLGVWKYESNEEEKAFSWLALVIEPVSNAIVGFDINKTLQIINNYQPKGKPPMERFFQPRKLKTTINSLILFNELKSQSSFWEKYIRIDKLGNFEFCDSDNIYTEYNDIRGFKFVNMIGNIWQFLFFVKFLFKEIDYRGGIRIFVNLIGAKNTILVNFSEEPGEGNKKWLQPGARDIFGRANLLELKCTDLNIRMQYDLILDNLDESTSLIFIHNIAEQLTLAYNHQTKPRCFNYETDVFPWNQFLREQSY